MPQGELNGWRYAYAEAGSGTPVVLLHGLMMDATLWDHQVDNLKDRFRVITIDAPGHGGSDARPAGIDFWQYAEDVFAICDRIGAGSAYFGGQSLGGFTILRGALLRPERVKGLILVDTSAREENPDVLPQYEAFLQVALQDGVSEDLAGMLFPIFFSATFAARPEAEPWLKKMLAVDVNSTLAMTRAVLDRDSVIDRLGEVRCPTIVIHGEEDLALPIDRAEELSRGIAGATLVRVPGAGHATPTERPDVVTPAIREFLERAEG